MNKSSTLEGEDESESSLSPDAATLAFLASRRTRSWSGRQARSEITGNGGSALPSRKASSGLEAPVVVGLPSHRHADLDSGDKSISRPGLLTKRSSEEREDDASSEASTNGASIAPGVGVASLTPAGKLLRRTSLEKPDDIDDVKATRQCYYVGVEPGGHSARLMRRPSFKKEVSIAPFGNQTSSSNFAPTFQPPLLTKGPSDEETGRVGTLKNCFVKVSMADGAVSSRMSDLGEARSLDSSGVVGLSTVEVIQQSSSISAPQSETTQTSLKSADALTAYVLQPAPTVAVRTNPSAEILLGLRLASSWFLFNDLVVMLRTCRSLRVELPASVNELSMSGRFESWHEGRMVPRFRDCGILDATVATAVAQFHRANYLDLSRCRRVTDRAVPHIAACLAATLRTLQLLRTQVSDLASLSSCVQLEDLGLEFTPVVNLAPLVHCPN